MLRPLLMLCAATPCAAQAPGHFANQSGYVTQASLSEAMGICVLKRNRSGAIALVVADTEAAEKIARERIHADMVSCLTSRPSATLDRLHLMSGIAERLLIENDRALLVRAAALPPVAPVRVVSGERAGQAALACAVRADPSDAAAMLRAAAATEQEAAAFRRLAPALQACAPAVGAVSIKSYVVRATVAIETLQAVHQSGNIGAIDAAREMHNA